MAQTEEEKQAAKDAKEREEAQKKAETLVAELTTKLEAAEKRAATADAKVEELEAKLEAAEAAAPATVAQRGTITANASGEVQ